MHGILRPESPTEAPDVTEPSADAIAASSPDADTSREVESSEVDGASSDTMSVNSFEGMMRFEPLQ